MDDNKKMPELDLYADPNQAPIEIKESKKTKKYAPRPWWREVLDYVFIVVVAYLIALFLTNFIIINCTVPSGSMLDTIELNDRIIGSRLTYKFTEPKRGDVVIFYANDKALAAAGRYDAKYGDILYIKRLVALPGDTIEVKDNQIYINGSTKPLDEPYLTDARVANKGTLANMKPYTLAEDEYFMMGDNRGQSSDSRAWGPVKKDEIVAKALFTYWPFNNIKWLAGSHEYSVDN